MFKVSKLKTKDKIIMSMDSYTALEIMRFAVKELNEHCDRRKEFINGLPAKEIYDACKNEFRAKDYWEIEDPIVCQNKIEINGFNVLSSTDQKDIIFGKKLQ